MNRNHEISNHEPRAREPAANSQQLGAKDIAITGIGCVTPAGESAAEFWKSCCEGTTGIRKNKAAGDFRGEICSTPLEGFERLVALAEKACREALNDADIDKDNSEDRIVCIVSTSKPNYFSDPLSFMQHYEGISSHIVRRLCLKAEMFSPVCSCLTGLLALYFGRKLLIDDQADVVLCGAVDSALFPGLLASYNNMGVLLNGKGPGSFAPFDLKRNGFYPGEGAGVVVLERTTRARKREVHQYGRLMNVVLHSEAYHPTGICSSGEGVAAVLHELAGSNGTKAVPDYLSLHGTATIQNDISETNGIKKVFGDDAYFIAASAVKPITGHMIGTSSIVEVITCLLAMRDNVIPPTINLHDEDPVCDLNYVPNRSIKKEVKRAVSLSCGFGSVIGGALMEKAGD